MSARDLTALSFRLRGKRQVAARSCTSVDFNKLTEMTVDVTHFAQPAAENMTKKAELSDNLQEVRRSRYFCL